MDYLPQTFINHRQIISVLFLIFSFNPFPCSADIKYSILIDAGSSSSKCLVYTLKSNGDSVIPRVNRVDSIKVKPGLATFIDDVTVVDGHVTQLLNAAKSFVPEEEHKITPVYLMATAGMRLILDTQADAIMERVDLILSNKSLNPFAYSRGNSRILSGEEEGVFAWIAVNYLRGFFDSETNHQLSDSVGVLELGGGSTQIAFIPEGNILANKFPLSIGGEYYPLYVHSYLYYGQDYAQKWIREKLVRSHDGPITGPLDHPCMLLGDSITKTVKGNQVSFTGVGDGVACESLLNDYVYDIPEFRCHPKPCAIGSHYQPEVPVSKDFYAIAAFIYYPTALQVLDTDGVFTPQDLRSTAMQYCSKNLEEAQAFTGESTQEYLSMNCLMGLYIPLLFTKGYEFPNDTNNIRAVREVDGERPDWTIGAIIYENERVRAHCPEISASTNSALKIQRSIVLPMICLLICFFAIFNKP